MIEAPAEAALTAASAGPLVEIAQAQGAAALISGDARLARVLKADGVHLPPSQHPEDAYLDARQIVGKRAIVGAHAGKSRHDAMLLGQAGADYVSFGIPKEIKDADGARERRLVLVQWWAEIFEVPVVALDVETPQDAEPLALAGADFIGVCLGAGTPLSEAAGHVRAIRDSIDIPLPTS
jgi:thiamine-phosphate pyrophosphorylase